MRRAQPCLTLWRSPRPVPPCPDVLCCGPHGVVLSLGEDFMRRREFITLLGGAAAAWPVGVLAQQPERMRRIGVLVGGTEGDPVEQARLAALRQGLERLGWSQGRNVRIDTRFAAGSADQVQTLAKELVALQPDVMLTHSTGFVAALQRESSTIPIVLSISPTRSARASWRAWRGRAAI